MELTPSVIIAVRGPLTSLFVHVMSQFGLALRRNKRSRTASSPAASLSPLSFLPSFPYDIHCTRPDEKQEPSEAIEQAVSLKEALPSSPRRRLVFVSSTSTFAPPLPRSPPPSFLALASLVAPLDCLHLFPRLPQAIGAHLPLRLIIILPAGATTLSALPLHQQQPSSFQTSLTGTPAAPTAAAAASSFTLSQQSIAGQQTWHKLGYRACTTPEQHFDSLFTFSLHSEASTANMAGRSGINTAARHSEISLTCIVCPKRPTFSDLSHLLTHLGSKGHLSKCFEMRTKAQSDLDCRVTMQRFEHWYARSGLDALMKDRFDQKEKKKNASAAGNIHHSRRGG